MRGKLPDKLPVGKTLSLMKFPIATSAVALSEDEKETSLYGFLTISWTFTIKQT